MPKNRAIEAHPATLALLHIAVGQGNAGSIQNLRLAVRVLEAIETVLEPSEDGAIPPYIDTTQVKTRAAFEARQAAGTVAQNAVWVDPAERKTVSVSEEQYEYLKGCWERFLPKIQNNSGRAALAAQDAIDSARLVGG